jgi:hypothetical protein
VLWNNPYSDGNFFEFLAGAVRATDNVDFMKAH